MTPTYILLSVADVPTSRDFYHDLLGYRPIEDSQTFCLFVLENGMKLGLWDERGMTPPIQGTGGFEFGIPVDSEDEVDRVAADWLARGISIIQPPVTMDFGRTFTALDPDGHRLRVLHPGTQP